MYSFRKDILVTRQQHSASLFAVFTSFWKHRYLIWQMTKRDVLGRYRGSLMGLAWSFFNPLLMLLVYTFVFSVVFRSRWVNEGETSKTDFAIILFVGLIIHSLFSECVNRAPSLILNNVNYVKKVIFPLEVLPWVALGSALFHACVSSAVLLTAFLVTNMYIPWTAIFFPIIAIPLILATMGLAWFLASTGVFVRDIGQTTAIITATLMFLSPVFYPASAMPASYQPILRVNPLTFIIEESREVLIWGHVPDWGSWAIYSAMSFAIAWAGFWWFQRTRRGFADVI